MTNWLNSFMQNLTQIFNLRNRPRELSGESEIRIIGPRRSGKTTFLAALARWPNARKDSPIESVDPFDDNTAILVNQAQDILENGLQFAGNYAPEDPNHLPLYTLLITMKSAFFGRSLRFQITCKDHPGEIFEDLRSRNLFEGKIDQYLGDITNVSGFLILIDGTSLEDREYAQALTSLKDELNIRLVGQGKNLRDIRIAIAFSKVENAQVWIYRQDIQGFMNRRFFQSTQALARWKKEWGCSMNYFFCSAFGTIGSPPEPNTRAIIIDRGATCAGIKRPEFWRPLGLVAPIYWLYTGKDDKRLRKLEDQ
jgi:hypothetical protein